ncbi:MAG TPA: DUF1549 domain-containing protein [Pirellulaceae bacterium]|nr:DUF1549 domain-containing protein [Pirellulaceae bacterium]
MKPDRDPILDACLDEVLGGRRPPDLTARILRALAEAKIDQKLPTPAVRIDDPALDVSVDPLVAVNGRAAKPVRRRAANPRTPLWQWITTAAAIGGLGIALGIAALRLIGPGADNPNQLAVRDELKGDKTQRTVEDANRQIAGNQNTKGSSDAAQVARAGGHGSKVIPLVVPGGNSDSQSPAAASDRPRYAQQPLPEAELLSLVNSELRRSWAEAGVNGADAAKDSEWCRRLFVRVLGRIPSHDEVTAFEQDKSPAKREQLVDRLLGEEYAEQFAQHWSNVWTNVLIGRTGGGEGSLASREGLQAYLQQSLQENKPYSQIVEELLTATGANRPGTADFNGAVNFLLAGINDNATLATARVSRVFLGQQLHCAQCHSHPSQEWSQHQYWALNSFLRQTDAHREGDLVRLVSADFVNKPSVTKEGEVYYQQSTTGIVKAATPEFIDGTKIPPSGSLAVVDRRQELAKLVVNSREMPRALVNRLWSHFFGYGFTSPIDDMGPHSEPSHPEVLDALAGQFVAHDYDFKRAVRWMVLSDAFSRSSRIPGGGLGDAPESGKTPLFSRYYSRPMKAEEVVDSLIAAADLRKKADNGAEIAQSRRDFLFQLHRQMGTDDGEEESHEGSNVQSELMMDSRLTRRAVSAEEGGRLKTLVAKDSLPMNEKIEHLFLAALSRKPTAQEQQAIGLILANAKDNQAAALEDIWWALLNSNEFILDH